MLPELHGNLYSNRNTKTLFSSAPHYVHRKTELWQSVSISKMSLSSLNDKRFILEGGIKTLPLSHADAIEAIDHETDLEWDSTDSR